MYEILFTEKATKSLRKLPKSDAKRILVKIDELAANPTESANVKQLTNHPVAAFRLRVGKYRVLFDKEDALKIIEIINIGNRKDISMTLQAQIIEENGEPKFAVLPYQSYQSLANELAEFDSLEDFLDYVHILKTKAENTRWFTRDQVWKELGLNE